MKPGRWASTAAALGLVLLGSVACGGSREPAPPVLAAAGPELTGCWYFEQTPTGLRLPWGVRLTDRRLEGWPALNRLEGVRLATTLTAEKEQNHPFGYWRDLAAADSLEIGYPAGGGLVLELEVQQTDPGRWPVLKGLARPVGDAVALGEDPAERAARPVRLTHAACPPYIEAGVRSAATLPSRRPR